MITVSFILFLFAAMLGAFLLTYLLKDKNTPKGVALIHGSLAATGLVVLILYALLYSAPLISILLFLAAAAGGFVLIYRDLTGKNLPKWLALGHGATAIIAFLFLLFFLFS